MERERKENEWPQTKWPIGFISWHSCLFIWLDSSAWTVPHALFLSLSLSSSDQLKHHQTVWGRIMVILMCFQPNSYYSTSLYQLLLCGVDGFFRPISPTEQLSICLLFLRKNRIKLSFFSFLPQRREQPPDTTMGWTFCGKVVIGCHIIKGQSSRSWLEFHQ